MRMSRKLCSQIKGVMSNKIKYLNRFNPLAIFWMKHYLSGEIFKKKNEISFSMFHLSTKFFSTVAFFPKIIHEIGCTFAYCSTDNNYQTRSAQRSCFNNRYWQQTVSTQDTLNTIPIPKRIIYGK